MRLLAAAGVVLSFSSLAAPAESARPAGMVARARYLMGAPLEARAPADPGGSAWVAAALDAALDEVERLDAVLSNWRGDSELSALNRSAALHPVACSADLFEALRAALQAMADTGGAFDPTLERRISALGLRAAGDPDEPPPGPLLSALSGGATLPPLPPRGGEMRLDPMARTVLFTSADLGVDLGGIGKGFALDRAARRLQGFGVHCALLNFGGQVLAIGAPPGEPGWVVEVADPSDRFRPAMILRLRDASVSTSANTQRGAWRDGQWIGHVLDPATGRPASFPGSATAVAPDATRADAYSTALLVMGPERGLLWAEGRADIAALFLDPASAGAPRVRATHSLDRYRGALPQGGAPAALLPLRGPVLE